MTRRAPAWTPSLREIPARRVAVIRFNGLMGEGGPVLDDSS